MFFADIETPRSVAQIFVYVIDIYARDAEMLGAFLRLCAPTGRDYVISVPWQYLCEGGPSGGVVLVGNVEGDVEEWLAVGGYEGRNCGSICALSLREIVRLLCDVTAYIP